MPRSISNATVPGDRRGLSAVAAVALPAFAVLVFLIAVRHHPGGPYVGRAIDDLAQLGAAAVAAAACWGRARRAAPGARRPWVLLGAATASWAVGEVIWSWFELVLEDQTPFPSLADAGFLLFDVLAAAALLTWPSTGLGGRRRLVTVFDGVQAAASLFILSWVTVLAAIARSGLDTRFALVISLAYPALDLVVLTLTLAVVARSRRAWESGLAVLAAGLVCLSVGDSGFAYLTAAGRYHTGSPVDAGWVGGFLLVAVAGWSTRPAPAAGSVAEAGRETALAVLLPYVPPAIALAVALRDELTGNNDRVVGVVAAVVVAALLLRQLIATLDNRRLVRDLLGAQQELHFRAFHDPLTGLANRSLFADRLRHGLELHRRDLRPLTLLFCDLDNFKVVNDTLGHDAGDEVLKAAAERLRAVTRAADTVARLGGDEFAILIEEIGTPEVAASRILDAFAQPARIGQHTVSITGSLGIVELAADAPPITAPELLRRADAAMYQAKRHTSQSAVLWTPELATDQRRGGLPSVTSIATFPGSAD